MDDSQSGDMPALYMPTSHHNSPERAVMLQRYLALHTRQDNISRQLSETSPSPPLSPSSTSMKASPEMSSSEPSSATTSPTLGSTQFSQTSPPAYALPKPVIRKNSSRSPTVAPIPEDDCLDEYEIPANHQSKLYNVNHEIKTTLTDLLNCEAVRNDGKMRLWIQTRLMDAEMQLKQQRRHRQRQCSSPQTPRPTIVLSPAEDNARRVSLP